MHVKSYFASTVEAAVEMARRELGPEAMLVNSRRTGPESTHLGRYEVVFARDEAPQRVESGELADIRRQLSGLRLAMTRSKGNGHTGPAELEATLNSAGVDPDLAAELAAGASAPYSPETILEAPLRVDSTLGATVALVGPPGRGKTTTLVKLAVLRGLAARVPVRLLSTDTLRIAAAEQLRSYAAILGIPFQIVETGPALEQALTARVKGLTLIDTPGFTPRERGEAAELARCFAAHPEIDVHLTLRVDAQYADLQRAVESYSIFRPAKLIFTGLDEAGCLGSAYSAAVRSGLALSFVAFGQQIPEDVQAATREDFVQRLMRGVAPAKTMLAMAAA